MSDYSVHTVASVIHGSLVQEPHPDATIEQLCIDSRKIVHAPASLFFALQTEHRNGHNYIKSCYEKGIRNFVIHQPVDYTLFPEANFILTNNTLQALHQLTAWHRKQFNIPVIGITGSNGKTIVKEWLYQLLSDSYRIVRSPKSYNSQVGVPLSIWQMGTEHNLAIIEAGISRKGEMQELQEIIQPTIGVFTYLGDAHQEGFASAEEKGIEKAILFKETSAIIYSPEQSGVHLTGTEHKEIISWGEGVTNKLQIISLQKEGLHTSLQLKWNNTELKLTIPFTDKASVNNAITCIAVCLYLKMDITQLKEKLLLLKPVSLRLEIKKGIQQCTIINDSYSADLSSFEIALNLLQQQRQHRKKTIILSDFILPKAKESETYHAIAQLITAHDIHKLVTVGPATAQHFATKVPATIQWTHFSTVDELIKQLPVLAFHNEAILIKGARVFGLEQIVPLLEQKVHQTVLEINLTAITHNLKKIREQIQQGTKIMAMVKAFSYGSGSYEIANLMQFNGVDYLAVAFADEGVELRKAGITLPIMVMNPEVVTFDHLIEYNLEPELYSFEIVNAFTAYLDKEGLSRYPVHLKIDTGMHRLGFTNDEVEQLCHILQSGNRFSIQTVFSHLAASEDPASDNFTSQQAILFEQACESILEKTGQSFIRHLCNSSGILRHPHLQYEMVRLGIAMYGITSHKTTLELEEALTLKTTIAQLKELQPGDSVGYNRKGVVTRPSVIATVRIGYADGFHRSLGNGKSFMLVNGQPAPVIGTVCMDMTMLDVTDVKDVKEGDDVIVFGKDWTIEHIAAAAGTIPYEIMTGISQRVNRVYFEE